MGQQLLYCFYFFNHLRIIITQFIRPTKTDFYETIYWAIVKITIQINCFGLCQSSISVGKICIIEYPHKLIVSKYMANNVGFLTSYDFKNLFLALAQPLQIIEIQPHKGVFNKLTLSLCKLGFKLTSENLSFASQLQPGVDK